MAYKSNELAADVLHELFEYKEGHLYWKVPGRSRRMGKPVGSISADGYVRVKINYKHYRVHRLVWAMHGKEPVELIDHINGNKLDNRIENLRAATQSQNCMNRCQRSDNKSGVKGVMRKKGKWYGCVTLDQKVHSAGYFDRKEDAAAAVDKLRKELHGKFARS